MSEPVLPLKRLAAVAATDNRMSAAYPQPEIVLGAWTQGLGGLDNGPKFVTIAPFRH
jgi:hypothetical protein